jgi:hypothetical protein
VDVHRPEVADVGLAEQQVNARGVAVRAFLQQLRELDRAILDSEAEGLQRAELRGPRLTSEWNGRNDADGRCRRSG